MGRQQFVNPTDLYTRSAAVARAAVTRSTTAEYAVADISDDADFWKAVFGTAFLSVVPLHATLDGCVQALKEHDVTDTQVAATGASASGQAAVAENDRDIARGWLVQTLKDDLDSDGQQIMIVDRVVENGWETHSVRLSSLMRAVVETADAAMAQAWAIANAHVSVGSGL
ncbi:MAG: hypothetical protein ACTHWA_02815 [Arachnia sp.]